MSKKVPFKVNFDTLKRVEKGIDGILYSSATISIILLVIEFTDLSNKEHWILNLNSVISILAVAYLLIDILQTYLFQSAEQVRKNDFIDNGLNTKFVEERSEEYFTNDEVQPGIYKLGVNCFENSFFTKNVSYKMIPWDIGKSVVVILLFIFLAVFTERKIIVTILQLSLPYTVIQHTIKLIVFHYKVESVFDKFKQIFSSSKKKVREHLLIENVINYEKILSWGNILLSSKIFNKNNEKWSEEWKKIKTEYKIN